MIGVDYTGPRARQDAYATPPPSFDARAATGLKATMDGNHRTPDSAAGVIDGALCQLQKLATLGQLTSEVAHDFGNLLTVMLGYSELLLADLPPGQPGHSYLEEVHRAAERASALTAQLLGYSRSPATASGPTDLAAVVRGLGDMLGRLFGTKADLSIAAADGCLASVDAKKAEQLVVNLLLNARDSLDAHDRRIDVSVEPVDLERAVPTRLGIAGPGRYVRLRVRDHGVGMSEDTLARLFRPFFTTKSTGTGLGLTIVARVAREADAAIAVHSSPGTGTTFDVFFLRAG